MAAARQTAATAVLLVIACCASVSVIGAPEIGALAPDFTAENYVTGEKVRLSAQQGKITVVMFWATWCAPCREELPNLEKLQRYLGKEKIAVLGLVTTKSAELESKDALKRRIEDATRYLPLEQLALGPQCGFNSGGDRGLQLSEAEQWRKFERIRETAEEVWG